MAQEEALCVLQDIASFGGPCVKSPKSTILQQGKGIGNYYWPQTVFFFQKDTQGHSGTLNPLRKTFL